MARDFGGSHGNLTLTGSGPLSLVGLVMMSILWEHSLKFGHGRI